jgi:hypothetical protein
MIREHAPHEDASDALVRTLNRDAEGRWVASQTQELMERRSAALMLDLSGPVQGHL